MNKIRIGATGYFNQGNLGDNLILTNFKKLYKENQITIFTPQESEQIPDSEIDVLYFAGGGLLTDLYIKKYYPKKLMDKIKIPIIILSAGIPHGQGYTMISKRIGYFINKMSFIGLRDTQSQEILKQLFNRESNFVPDLAYLTPSLNLKKTNDPILQQKKRICTEFKKLTPPNYLENVKELYSKLPYKIMSWDSNPQKAIREIAQTKLLICNSLHAGIIAYTQNTPFLIIPYQDKCYDALFLTTNKTKTKKHKYAKQKRNLIRRLFR